MAAPLSILGSVLLLAASAAGERRAGPAPAPDPVLAALRRALAVPDGRLELVGWRPALPPGCALERAEVPRPVERSGNVAVRLLGRDPAGDACEGWTWASVRVWAPALVATRKVNEGDALESAVRLEEREVLAGEQRPRALPPGATAARPIAAGEPLEAGQLRVGPRPGESVAVTIRMGTLTVEQRGRALPCTRGRTCAQLPSGKRVEGQFQDGRLIVEL
jgi:hypothetical protein